MEKDKIKEGAIVECIRTPLGRPKNEKPYLLIPVGYAHKENVVPDIKRKHLEEVLYEYA